MNLTTQVDHLVIAAQSLEQGVAWCEQTLGVSPGAGGKHAKFGTHNRLLRIGNAKFPTAYLEIIAIDSGAFPADSTVQKCWFDLENEAVRAAIAINPRLLHVVASTSDLDQSLRRLQALGIDRGAALTASRMTAQGLLEWRISVRPDGQRLFNGILPSLIEWGDSSLAHPTQHMPGSSLSLLSVRATHPQYQIIETAYQALGLQHMACESGAANLCAELQTPRGRVMLESLGI